MKTFLLKVIDNDTGEVIVDENIMNAFLAFDLVDGEDTYRAVGQAPFCAAHAMIGSAIAERMFGDSLTPGLRATIEQAIAHELNSEHTREIRKIK